MLHNIEPHVFNNQFIENATELENDYILHYKNNTILLIWSENGHVIPQRRNFSEPLKKEHTMYLFTLNGQNCFLLREYNGNENHFTYHEHTFLRTMPSKELAYIGAVGYHMAGWVNDHAYCSRCGSKTILKKTERAVICPSCEFTVYPKISPAIIVAIICNDKILLAKGKHYKFNFYSLIAGYVDIGETLEQTVIREAKEEIGIDVTNIRYFGNQPWPFTSSQMIGFFAEADEHQPIVVNEDELHDAKWFSLDNMPEIPNNISIAGEMIEAFRKGKYNG
jgi:NAD+ diphosphatase